MSQKINGAKTPRAERLARRYKEGLSITRILSLELNRRITSWKEQAECADCKGRVMSGLKAFLDAARLQMRLEQALLAQAPVMLKAFEQNMITERHHALAQTLDALEKEGALCEKNEGLKDVLAALAERSVMDMIDLPDILTILIDIVHLDFSEKETLEKDSAVA